MMRPPTFFQSSHNITHSVEKKATLSEKPKTFLSNECGLVEIPLEPICHFRQTAKFHAGYYVRILKHVLGFPTALNFLTVFCLNPVRKLKAIIYTFLAKGIANTVTKIVSFTYSKDPVF